MLAARMSTCLTLRLLVLCRRSSRRVLPDYVSRNLFYDKALWWFAARAWRLRWNVGKVSDDPETERPRTGPLNPIGSRRRKSRKA